MKHYLFIGLVVLSAGLKAADNPFDLKQNLQSLDKGEEFILLELDKVSKTKGKKTAPEAKKKSTGTNVEMIHSVVTQPPPKEAETKIVEEKTTSLAKPNDSELAGVEENTVADDISNVVSDTMVEDKDVPEVKEVKELKKTEENKNATTSSDKKTLKIIIQDAPARKKPEMAVAPAQKEPVLEVQTTKGSELTQEEIDKIYNAALKEAKGK